MEVLGYDPNGEFLFVADVRDPAPTPSPNNPDLLALFGALFFDDGGGADIRVIDATTGAIVDDLDGITFALWTGQPNQMMAVFADGTHGIYDVAHHRRVPGITVPLDIVATRSLADPAHSRFVFWDWEGRVRAFGPDGKPTDPSFDLPNPIFTLGISRDGTTLVTVFPDYGLVAFDIATGKQVAGPVPGYVNVAVSPSDEVVADTYDGRLALFDAKTLEPLSDPLPSALGHIGLMRFNGVGRFLLLTTGDRNFRLVDFASRTVLGEPIPSTSSLPLNHLTSDLRQDNRQLALTTDDGIAVWELDPDVWVSRRAAGWPRAHSRRVGAVPL